MASRVKVHFNPSTQKIQVNPITKKVLVSPCLDCYNDGQVQVTFTGVQVCPGKSWPSDLNRAFILNYEVSADQINYFSIYNADGWNVYYVCGIDPDDKTDDFGAVWAETHVTWKTVFSMLGYHNRYNPMYSEIQLSNCGVYVIGYGGYAKVIRV